MALNIPGIGIIGGMSMEEMMMGGAASDPTKVSSTKTSSSKSSSSSSKSSSSKSSTSTSTKAPSTTVKTSAPPAVAESNDQPWKQTLANKGIQVNKSAEDVLTPQPGTKSAGSDPMVAEMYDKPWKQTLPVTGVSMEEALTPKPGSTSGGATNYTPGATGAAGAAGATGAAGSVNGLGFDFDAYLRELQGMQMPGMPGMIDPLTSKWASWGGFGRDYYQGGILSVEADPLAYDPLKNDPLRGEYDPKSPDAGKRVASYYSALGVSLYPEEMELVNQNFAKLSESDKQAVAALFEYKHQFESQLAAADAKAKGQIGTIKATPVQAPSLNLVSYNVISPQGKVEGTYKLPASVAAELSKNGSVNIAGGKGGYNVSVVTKEGKIIGAELHTALGDASSQVSTAVKQQQKLVKVAQEQANYLAEVAKRNAENEYMTQRNLAIQQFDQEFGMGLERYKLISGDWESYLADLKSGQKTGKANTTKAINDLNESGILSFNNV